MSASDWLVMWILALAAMTFALGVVQKVKAWFRGPYVYWGRRRRERRTVASPRGPLPVPTDDELRSAKEEFLDHQDG